MENDHAPEKKPPPRFSLSPEWSQNLRDAPATFVLVAVNVVVFLAAERWGDTKSPPTLLAFGADERVHVWAGEYWRLATSMFLHIGWVHLLWAVWALPGWCIAVERALGSRRFLFVYLVAGVGGASVSAIGQAVVSAGSSGAGFGIVGATLYLRYRLLGSWKAFTADKATQSVLFSIALWTVIGLTALPMDNLAHGGGLVVGAGATWILAVRGQHARTARAAFGVLVALLVLGAVRPWWRTEDDAERLAAFAREYRLGERYAKSPRRAERFATVGCRAGSMFACWELAKGAADSGDAARSERAVIVIDEVCAKNPSACPLERAPRDGPAGEGR